MGKPKGIQKNKRLGLHYTNRKQPPKRLDSSSNSSRKGQENVEGSDAQLMVVVTSLVCEVNMYALKGLVVA